MTNGYDFFSQPSMQIESLRTFQRPVDFQTIIPEKCRVVVFQERSLQASARAELADNIALLAELGFRFLFLVDVKEETQTTIDAYFADSNLDNLKNALRFYNSPTALVKIMEQSRIHGTKVLADSEAERIINLLKQDADRKVILLTNDPYIGETRTELTAALSEHSFDPFIINLSPAVNPSFADAVWEAGLFGMKFAVPVKSISSEKLPDFLVHLPNSAREEFDACLNQLENHVIFKPDATMNVLESLKGRRKRSRWEPEQIEADFARIELILAQAYLNGAESEPNKKATAELKRLIRRKSESPRFAEYVQKAKELLQQLKSYQDGYDFLSNDLAGRVKALEDFQEPLRFDSIIPESCRVVLFGEMTNQSSVHTELSANMELFAKLGFRFFFLQALKQERQPIIDAYYQDPAAHAEELRDALEQDWNTDAPGFLSLIAQARKCGIKVCGLFRGEEETDQLVHCGQNWANTILELVRSDPDARVMLLAGIALVERAVPRKNCAEIANEQRLVTVLNNHGPAPFVIYMTPCAGYSFADAVWQAGLFNKKFAVPMHGTADTRISDYLVHLPNSAREYFENFMNLANECTQSDYPDGTIIWLEKNTKRLWEPDEVETDCIRIELVKAKFFLHKAELTSDTEIRSTALAILEKLVSSEPKHSSAVKYIGEARELLKRTINGSAVS